MLMKWITALTESVAPAAEVAAEIAAPVIEATAAPSGLVALPLFTKGLLTTVMGLLGVFIVLALFFITIKLMQKLGK